MADTPEQKTLNEIKEVIKDQNASQKKLSDAYEKSQKAFPAESFKKLSKETGDEIKKQRQSIKKMLDDTQNGEGVSAGLSKFLGVDFKSEFFGRLEKVTQGFGEIKKGFADLGKALGLQKVAKVAGGFWDFLKKIFTIGLATVGFIKFIEGWNKADEIFGKAAGFGERLSAGLATVIGSFMGLTDGEINKLAKDINVTVQGIITFLKTEFDALTTALKAAWPNIKQTFGGFIKILEGDFIGGITDITGGVIGVGTELLNSESMLAKAVVVLAGIKLLGAVTSFATAIGPIFTALSTIGTGIGTIFTALGGKAAFTAAMATLAPTLGSILIPLGLALAAVVALKSIFDGFKAGYDEFEKSGDISQALSAGLGGFVKSLLNMLTLGLLSDDTLNKVEESVKKFVDPILEQIGDLFKSIWNWVKDSYDDAVFAVKDFLGMELSQAERLKKADKDISEAENSLLEAQAKLNEDPNYVPYKKRVERAQNNLQKAQQEKYDLANQNEIDNKILQSGVSTYYDYMNSLIKNKQLTDEQRAKELEEARVARSEGKSFQNFQTSQITQNNAIIQKIRPQIPVGAN